MSISQEPDHHRFFPGGLVIIGEQVVRVEGSKFLGVWVDAEHNWKGHINQVGRKMRRLLGVLGRARVDFIERLLVSLYDSMVLQHLHYCLMV
jgi:hypothetical protein